jgi:hypothetical protein
MADETQDNIITKTELPAVDSTDVSFPDNGSTLEGGDGKETIVHDTDENGNVVGWHKESA